MAKNYALKERQRRIEAIKAALSKAKIEDTEISFVKLKAELGIQYGLSERKINEYFEQMINAGLIHIKHIDNAEIVELK